MATPIQTSPSTNTTTNYAPTGNINPAEHSNSATNGTKGQDKRKTTGEDYKKQSNNQSVKSLQTVQADEQEEVAEMAKRAKQHKKWNRRLKIFFCCLGYKKNKVSVFWGVCSGLTTWRLLL